MDITIGRTDMEDTSNYDERTLALRRIMQFCLLQPKPFVYYIVATGQPLVLPHTFRSKTLTSQRYYRSHHVYIIKALETNLGTNRPNIWMINTEKAN